MSEEKTLKESGVEEIGYKDTEVNPTEGIAPIAKLERKKGAVEKAKEFISERRTEIEAHRMESETKRKLDAREKMAKLKEEIEVRKTEAELKRYEAQKRMYESQARNGGNGGFRGFGREQPQRRQTQPQNQNPIFRQLSQSNSRQFMQSSRPNPLMQQIMNPMRQSSNRTLGNADILIAHGKRYAVKPNKPKFAMNQSGPRGSLVNSIFRKRR